MYRFLTILAFLFCAMHASAQKMPERKMVRTGNRQFEKGRYEQSISSYLKATETTPGNFEATYNLGNALYKAGQFDKAEQTLTVAANDSLRTHEERAEAFYNLGNTLFKQKKYEQALESYKQSLRINPSDEQAKFNYAYTKLMLQNNPDEQQKQKKEQEKQEQEKQEQEKKEQEKQDQDPQKDTEKPQEPEPNKPEPNDKAQAPEPQSGISKQEQERMLDAIQAQEDRTQDKLKQQEGVVVQGTKNW